MRFNYKEYRNVGSKCSNCQNPVDMNKIDEFIRQQDKDSSDAADFTLLMDGLQELETWCNSDSIEHITTPKEKRVKFFEYFQDAIMGAYCRYRRTKVSAWSFGKNWPWLICATALPLLSAIVIYVLTEGDGGILGLPSVVTGVVFAVVIAGNTLLDWKKHRNYYETWVRHSTCFGRLNLVLSEFILSGRTNEDYTEFVSATFAILNQNLDQFALNLSGQGLAERTESD